MKGALGILCSPELKFRSCSSTRRYILDVGGGEPYSEPSQQVEEAEVTGESFTHHDRTPMHGAVK